MRCWKLLKEDSLCLGSVWVWCVWVWLLVTCSAILGIIVCSVSSDTCFRIWCSSNSVKNTLCTQAVLLYFCKKLMWRLNVVWSTLGWASTYIFPTYPVQLHAAWNYVIILCSIKPLQKTDAMLTNYIFVCHWRKCTQVTPIQWLLIIIFRHSIFFTCNTAQLKYVVSQGDGMR